MKKTLTLILMSFALLGLTNKNDNQDYGKYTYFQYYSEIQNLGTRFSLGAQLYQGNITFECDADSEGECTIYANTLPMTQQNEQVLKADGHVVEPDRYYEVSEEDHIVIQPGEKLTFDKEIVGLFLNLHVSNYPGVGMGPIDPIEGPDYDFKLNISSDGSAQTNTNAYDYLYNKNAKTTAIVQDDLYMFTVGREISKGYATITCEESDTGTCSVSVDRFSTTYKFLDASLLRPARCGYRMDDGVFTYNIPVGESVECPYEFLSFDNFNISVVGKVNITMEQ